jgi:hypothetical protein
MQKQLPELGTKERRELFVRDNEGFREENNEPRSGALCTSKFLKTARPFLIIILKRTSCMRRMQVN